MATWARYGIWIAVALGLFFRGFHYLRQPSVWHDEAAVLVNVVKLDFAEMTSPLHFHEAAPLLFLWVERALFLTLGDDILVLRLFPFVASCLSLFLIVVVARRWLDERGSVFVVALFACSEKLIWHASEAKPYALDVFSTLVVVALFSRLDHWSLARRCLLHAAVAPFLLTLSYPACFVHGGLLLALLPTVWQERTWSTTLSYTLLIVAVLGTFLGVVLPVSLAQHDPHIHSDWTKFFPNWSEPLSVPGWALIALLEVLRYGCHPHGQLLVLPVIVGAITWWRSERRPMVILCLAPIGVALIAACMHRYPLGGSRVQIYAAPLLLLMSGAGVETLLRHVSRRVVWLPLATTALVLVTTLLYANRRVIRPWPRPDTQQSCAWVSAHWLPGDAIVCNDWTHQYYLRALEADICATPAGEPIPGERLWLIWTEQVPVEIRHQHMRVQPPPDWVEAERQEFESTTVVLLRRREPSGIARND